MAETTMILTDNSEDGINGDYPPSRWESQIDAVSILLASKYQAMSDNAAGLATMAGKAVDVLCTPTQDGSKVSSTLFGAKVGGHIHLVNALQISILALKNRPNPRTKQRILLFVGSKITESVDEVRVIGKKLAKNSVAITIFSFGETSAEQKAKIEALYKAVNNEDNSSVYVVERGRNLTDTLVSSSLFRDDKDKQLSAAQVDADLDPELALAIKMSLEENQRREAEEAAKAAALSANSADKPLDERNVMKVPEDKMEIEKPKPKEPQQPQLNPDELDDEQAEELAKQLSLQEAERQRERDANLKVTDKMEQEGDEKDDKKKKEQDKQTLASEKFEQSEIQKGDVGISDFLTEKHNPVPKDSQTQKFMNQKFKDELDQLADDDDEEENEDNTEGGKKKGGKKDKNKSNLTERHDRKKEDEI